MTKQRKRDSLLQKILLMSKDLYAIKQKALKSCLYVCFRIPLEIYESVHREGVNPSSMDGVPDLHDHNSFCSALFPRVRCVSMIS